MAYAQAVGPAFASSSLLHSSIVAPSLAHHPHPSLVSPLDAPQRARRVRRVSPSCVIEALNKLEITADLDTPAASGSFGDVFFGTLQPGNEPVVLKRARSDPTARALFSAERRVNRKLARPEPDASHWPRFLGDYFRDSQTFLVWRREGDGDTLADYLFTRPPSALCGAMAVSPTMSGRPNFALFRAVARTLLQALGALHARGIVHRDVKPGNILVVPAEAPRLRLIDFGSARDLRAPPWPGLVDTLDPLWAPPEQRINALAPQRFDVFCVGLTAMTALMPSFASEGRVREFRATLEAADFDLAAYRRELLLRCGGTLPPGDSDLAALFDENDAQAVDAFNLLCGLLRKSPLSRTTVETALVQLGPE